MWNFWLDENVTVSNISMSNLNFFPNTKIASCTVWTCIFKNPCLYQNSANHFLSLYTFLAAKASIIREIHVYKNTFNKPKMSFDNLMFAFRFLLTLPSLFTRCTMATRVRTLRLLLPPTFTRGSWPVQASRTTRCKPSTTHSTTQIKSSWKRARKK